MASIERRQFTAWDREYLPEFDNPEYLEYETVKSGLSQAICTYGYYDNWNKTWVKLKDLDLGAKT